MKLRIEIDDALEDEIIIRSRSFNDEVRRLQNAIESVTGNSELVLTKGDDEYFLPISDILFFETADGRIAAHTANEMYFSEEKLYKLEELLPRYFVRVSKSCILNSAKVDSLRKGLTGSAEAYFRGSFKKAYISRMYYKILKDTIYETRLLE